MKIDKNIPIPNVCENRQGANGYSKYPWRDLEVGDSFAVPFLTPKSQSRITALAAYQSRARGHKYVTRVTNEAGKKMVRLWRVK